MKFRIVIHHFANSSDAETKIVYMTLQDHVVKGSDEFMEGNSSLYIPNLPKWIAIDIALIDIIILVC